MSQPFVGEIRQFAGNFAPAGWAFCDGQLMAISENETLFNLIGTTYGGDGQSTFALPDLRGRLALHQGSGYSVGESFGTETVTLTSAQMPNHTHALVAAATATSPQPTGNVLAAPSAGELFLEDSPALPMNAGSIQPTGGNQPHENTAPYQCVSYIISMYGIYPSPA